MIKMFELQGKYTKALVTIDNVEAECISQIMGFLNHPLYEGCNIVIQPDTHGGKGSVIGFTCTLSGKGVCSNVVGVDLSCGINCWEIDEVNLMDRLDSNVRKVVPLGATLHKSALFHMEKDYPWRDVSKDVWHFVAMYNKKFGTDYIAPDINYGWYKSLAEKLLNKGQKLDDFLGNVDRSVGTLGGGNHFIEVDIDKRGQHYLVIHSGSRNLGKRVAEYFQKLAEGQEHNAGYNKDLAYLKGQDAVDYFVAMVFMKKFASLNRDTMGELISKHCDLHIRNKIETTHNFIDDKDFVIRKGAIRSYKGERMIIPFNMRDGSWIVEGKSNEEWNNSAPHGAGRVMSRNQAKRTLKLEDFEEQMKGIYTTSVCRATLDEAPDTYKPAAIIQDAIKDTATIIHNLKPVYNLKSSEEGVFGKKKKFATSGNTPDDVWARVKETLPQELITKNTEQEYRAEFERSPRDFCEKYREE